MQKYDILDMIDEGAYGIVWKAVNKQTQQFVAIKQFKETDDDQDTKRTIQREIKMLKMLKGDYVVGLRQAFKKKGKIYLIFQFFPKNLLNLIQSNNQGLQPNLIKLIVYKAVKCLKFLHDKNIIHRDIKPQNILLNQSNEILKFCDFGFARFIPQNLKEMTDYVATRWYRSPELLVGEAYNKPSDMFALGCIIGQLVDGQPMFPGQDQIDQIFLLKKYIGQLTSNQHRCLFDNHKFSGGEIPPIKKKLTLDERYLGKIQKNALLFMKSCLKMDADERLTAEQALKHPYLIQLSTMDNYFQNDEQNLMSVDRKTVPKNQFRFSNSSLINEDDQNKNQSRIVAADSVIIKKGKSISKVEKSLKINYGSVDYSKSNSKSKSTFSNYERYEAIQKKISQADLIQLKQSNSPPKQSKDSKMNKNLKKHMSQEKHLKVNFDVNVNINVKINKKQELKVSPNIQRDISNKLPQLKPNPKGFLPKNKQIFFGFNRKLGSKSNLSINGQSKQITKNLLSKKLEGISLN